MATKKQTTCSALEIITLIEKLWNNKELCDKKGFKEVIRKKPTREHYVDIWVYTKGKDKENYVFPLSLEEYKQFKVNKFMRLGIK